jgi:hypothetical protein
MYVCREVERDGERERKREERRERREEKGERDFYEIVESKSPEYVELQFEDEGPLPAECLLGECQYFP